MALPQWLALSLVGILRLTTTVDHIIRHARLRAAAEASWRDATHLHDGKAWKIGEHYKLLLREFYRSTEPFNQNEVPELPELPYLLLTAEATILGVRIIVTAPTIDKEWFWIACRFHWRNGIENNYT